VGRQIKIQDTDIAYIAGFLDGDGSVIVQVKSRRDTPRGWRLMFTICFYQDTRHEKPLFWIQKKLGIGYIARRNDGMTELRINGYKQIKRILELFYPYLKFKEKQVKYILEILNLVDSTRNFFKLGKEDRIKIANLIFKARQETYQSGSKKLEKLKIDLERIKNI